MFRKVQCAALADRTCVLDDESVGLKGLTDMLSYAAFRLENLGRSAPPVDGTNGQRALVLARIGSMEHLYRMAFSLSRIYLDRSQSGVYFGGGARAAQIGSQAHGN